MSAALRGRVALLALILSTGCGALIGEDFNGYRGACEIASSGSACAGDGFGGAGSDFGPTDESGGSRLAGGSASFGGRSVGHGSGKSGSSSGAAAGADGATAEGGAGGADEPIGPISGAGGIGGASGQSLGGAAGLAGAGSSGQGGTTAGGTAGQGGSSTVAGSGGGTTVGIWPLSASNYFSQSASDIAVASRAPNLLDLFRIDAGVVKLLRWVGFQYQADPTFKNPPGVSSLGSLSAVTNGGRLDVFATGSDHHIWHMSSDVTTGAPTFSSWVADVPGNPTVADGSSVAAACTAAGDLHVFWWTTSLNLGHAVYSNNSPAFTETGDSSVMPWFKPEVPIGSPRDLSVVSPLPGVIHLVYPLPQTSSIAHVWYDGVSWGTTDAPNRESFLVWSETHLQGSSVSITSTGLLNLEIFLLAHPATDLGTANTDIYHTAFNGSWRLRENAAARTLVFERVTQPTSLMTPTALCSALQWDTPTPRLDLYGVGGPASLVWQGVRCLGGSPPAQGCENN